MSLLDKIKIEDLDGDQRDIADLIGLESYKELVRAYGGCRIYIYKAESLSLCKRNEEIRKKFTGCNARDLAIEYNLSERMIQEITSDELQTIKLKPLDGQLIFM